MYNGPISRATQMTCSACGTSGISPRAVKTETREQIVTEAKYICYRCSNYFHKSVIAVVNKDVSTS